MNTGRDIRPVADDGRLRSHDVLHDAMGIPDHETHTLWKS
jgi:hypothetical protein